MNIYPRGRRIGAGRIFLFFFSYTLSACSSNVERGGSSTYQTAELSKSNRQVQAPESEESLLYKINTCKQDKERYVLMLRLAELRSKSTVEKQEKLLEQIATAAGKLFGRHSVEFADNCCRQARLAFRKQDFPKSAELWTEASKIYELKGAECQEKLMPCISGQIAAECANGKCSKQVELYEKLLELRRRCLGNDDQQTMIAAMLLAEVYSKKGDQKKALELFQEVYDWSLSKSAAESNAASLNVARTLIKLREFSKAEPLMQSVLDYARTHPENGRINPLLISALKVKLHFLDEQKRYKESVKVAEEILDLNEKQMGPEHPQLTTSIRLYADALQNAGQKKAAQEQEKRIRNIEFAGVRSH